MGRLRRWLFRLLAPPGREREGVDFLLDELAAEASKKEYDAVNRVVTLLIVSELLGQETALGRVAPADGDEVRFRLAALSQALLLDLRVSPGVKPDVRN